MITTILFDLDDTLFDQREHLRGAYSAVADCAADCEGLPRDRVTATLWRLVEERGTASGRLFNDLGQALGCAWGEVEIEVLVNAFYRYRPAALPPFPGVVALLETLAQQGYRLGVVTDGRPALQRDKLALLHLPPVFGSVVVSDELGWAFRKPHRAPYLRALADLDTAPSHALYVGDNPRKDFAGANALGLTTVRVLTGEYAPLSSTDWPLSARAALEIPTVADLPTALRGMS